jgi:phosphoadenosine phosphosulfate reductase
MLGDAAIVSSFGAESAVLLHLIASIDPTVPVLFLETGKHFPETLSYREALRDRLIGLTDLRDLTPDPALLRQKDENRPALVLRSRRLL